MCLSMRAETSGLVRWCYRVGCHACAPAHTINGASALVSFGKAAVPPVCRHVPAADVNVSVTGCCGLQLAEYASDLRRYSRVREGTVAWEMYS